MPTTQRETAQSWLLSAVDRTFDLAEQTLAAQRQFALALTGGAARHAEIAADTVTGAIDDPERGVSTPGGGVGGCGPQAGPQVRRAHLRGPHGRGAPRAGRRAGVRGPLVDEQGRA